MAKTYLIGVDLGTSGTKAALYHDREEAEVVDVEISFLVSVSDLGRVNPVQPVLRGDVG